MPAIKALGDPQLTLRRTYAFSGQEFLVLTANRVNGQVDDFRGPKHPYNVQYSHYLGEPGWVALQVRQGDRPWGDSTAVDRIGLDGWIDPMPNGDRVLHLKFEIVFESGCIANAGDWLNFCEVHARKLPGVTEFDGAGPLGLHLEWSYGGARPCFRIYTRRLTLDAYGKATGNVQTMVFEASSVTNAAHQVVEGVKYTFEIDLYPSEDNGYLHIKKDGVLIVDINGQPVGYGPERRLYPQFRMYRATRANIGKLQVHPLEVTYPKVPDLPGVTRGQELIRDGMFDANSGAWTDVDSNVDCGMTWESDGAGGGLMRSYTTGGVGDLDQQARFKRRLDILEVGETYELKHSGTFGIGAAPFDGGYYDPATRYLIPAQGTGGAEVVRQFTATSETVFIGGANPVNGRWVDSVSLKRVIIPT